MPELKLKLTAGTNVGLVRDNNEDNFVVCRDLINNDWTIPQAGETTDLGPYGALLIVADGMGGANAGEVASRIAIETIQQAFMKCRLANVVKSEANVLEFLCSVTRDADKSIVKYGKKHKEARGMGTTVVMAWILQDKAYICWCGDSRCYVFNPAVGLTRLSKDHSLVQQLVDSGELSPENAHDHPMSNVITQCLGNSTKKIDPDTRVYQMAHNDVLLLCSDGLSSLCTDDEMMQVMVANDDIVVLKNQLIEAALNAGGYDNVTVAICHVDAPSLSSVKANAQLNATLRTDSEPTEAAEEEDAEEEVVAEPEIEVEPTEKPAETETPESSDDAEPSTGDAETTDAETTDEAEVNDATAETVSQPQSRWTEIALLVMLLLLVVAAIVLYASAKTLLK